MEVYYKRIKSNRKTSKRLCLVPVTVIAQDNTSFFFLAKVVSASSGAMIGLFLILIFFRHFNVLKSSLFGPYDRTRKNKSDNFLLGALHVKKNLKRVVEV
jgi:hypothetical protein